MFLFEYPYRRIRVVDEAHVQTDARVQDPDDCIGAVSRLLISKLETDIVPVISENPQWAGSVVVRGRCGGYAYPRLREKQARTMKLSNN